MIRRLSRNKKYEDGILFGGISTNDVVVWLSREQYDRMEKPRRIEVSVRTDKRRTTVKHTHTTTYGG
jgi:hypothetical protein